MLARSGRSLAGGVARELRAKQCRHTRLAQPSCGSGELRLWMMVRKAE
jgi:hypothetical protein